MKSLALGFDTLFSGLGCSATLEIPAPARLTLFNMEMKKQFRLILMFNRSLGEPHQDHIPAEYQMT